MSATHKKASVAAKPPKHAASSSRISLLVPKDLKGRIDRLARAERRTMNKQCELLLERGLDREQSAA